MGNVHTLRGAAGGLHLGFVGSYVGGGRQKDERPLAGWAAGGAQPGRGASPDGVDFLTKRWREGDNFESRLSTNREFFATTAPPRENFTPLVIGDLYFAPPRPPWLRGILDGLRALTGGGDLVHFFERTDLLPPDVDCTAVGYSLALRARRVAPATALGIARRVAANTHSTSGIICVYFDPDGPRRNRVDAVVCLNALYLINQVGLSEHPEAREAITATERYVFDYLQSGQYEAGSRYYPSPATYLYFLVRLVSRFPARYRGWLVEVARRIKSHQGRDSQPLELAQRALAAMRLGIDASLDTWLLRKARQTNGSFPGGVLYRYGRSARYFGGQTIATAFAARALIECASSTPGRGQRR